MVGTAILRELGQKPILSSLYVINNEINKAERQGFRTSYLLPGQHQTSARVLWNPLLCSKGHHARNQSSSHFWEGESGRVLCHHNVCHARKQHASTVGVSVAYHNYWKLERKHCFVKIPKEI